MQAARRIRRTTAKRGWPAPRTPSLFDEQQIEFARDLQALLDGGYIVAVGDGPQTRFALSEASPPTYQPHGRISRPLAFAPQEVHA